MQKSITTNEQQQITPFFDPAPESISQSFAPLNKDTFVVKSEGKNWSDISGKLRLLRKIGMLKIERYF